MRRNTRAPLLLVVLLLVVATALAWFLAGGQGRPAAPTAGPQLLLAVMDVGQADSLLLRAPSGRSMLIDSGNERADVDRVVLPFLRSRGIDSLDYVVLTHPDQDHVGGMPALLDGLRVGAFVDAALPGITNQSYLQSLQRVQSKGIKAMKARRGQTEIDLGSETRVQLLQPEEPLLGRAGSDTNDNSVVLRVTYGSVSALLTGDMEREEEERLLAHRDDLRSQILKVAHHGSQGTTSAQFLEAVDPEVALISAGAGNSYGHPHRQLLQRLENRQVKPYRTDLHGTIQVTTDGRSYQVTPEKLGGG